MFSFQIHIPLASELGQRLPFVQHLASLALVKAVRSAPGYEDVPLTLKWPNDIYVDSSHKIGGVIVEASTYQGTVIVSIGKV